jgi:transposase
MDVVVERVAGLDVHKASVTACVRVPNEAGERVEHVETFATTVPSLLVLSDWLEAHGVTQVAMEATGVYWKPVWAILEDRFQCILVNARHVKQVPGRKTDVTDAQWLCRLAEAGLLRASLVPPKPIRTLRNLTRYRKAQTKDRQREAGRLHKILEDTGIKLDCVASDLLGMSGRAMLGALISGTTDPEVLADLAKGKLRAKLPALREALHGRFATEHAIIVGRILAHIEYLDEAIAELSTVIEEQIAPFAKEVELLCTIPGVQRRTAEVIIAETGGDMTAFPTAKHLASWAGFCPGNDESAGKRRSGKTRKGSKWLRANMIEAAKAASRTKDTYLAAQYQRLRARRGHAKATTAVAHSMLVAAWHMLSRDSAGPWSTVVRSDPSRRDGERRGRFFGSQGARRGSGVCGGRPGWSTGLRAGRVPARSG